MGLILGFILLPTALILLGNILASFIYIRLTSINKLMLSVFLGLCIAVAIFLLLSTSGQTYIFSFILNIIIAVLVILLFSTVLFLRKDVKHKRKAIQIVTGILSMLLGLCLSFAIIGSENLFHY